ncbi:MAG: LamG domain-containing protein, partial [Bacteroidetes bacterium]|nr:LamG domain-containing protein [Bacteroidota bacterium]
MTNSYKIKYFTWFLTFILSSICYLIVSFLINTFYHPNIKEAIEYGLNVTIEPADSLLPESKEKLLFISGVIIFSICLFIFYYLINKIVNSKYKTEDFNSEVINKHSKNKTKKKKEPKSINILYYFSLFISMGFVIFITYMGFVSKNPFGINMLNVQDSVAKTNWDFYFLSTFLHKYLYVYLLILFPLILFCYLYNFKYSEKTFSLLNKTGNIFVTLFCFSIIFIVFLISVFKFPYTYENKYDFNAVYYSVVQVFNGVPMLVDHFTNTYGLYPHFVTPILKIFGLSILNFTIIMSILLSSFFLFLFLFLKKIIQNKFLILFGFTTIFFNSYAYFHIITNYDSTFSTTPIRWILLFSLIYYSTIYLNLINKTQIFNSIDSSRKQENNHKNIKVKILYYLSFFIFSSGILWNPEIGMLTYLCLIAFYSFLELENQNFKTILKRILIHIITAIAVLAITFLSYFILIKIFYGNYPQLSEMFTTIRIFSFIGFGMLPMPLTFHPWQLIILIYVTGFLYSVQNIITKKINAHTAVIFLLTILGIGYFLYYQGRSHNWSLFTCSPMAFILLTIFADDLYKIIKKQRIFIIPFALLIFMLSFSFFQTIYDYEKITDLIVEKNNKEKNKEEDNYIIKNGNYIRNLTNTKEKILIFTANFYQALYHNISNTVAAINPGFVDIALKSDYNNILSFLIKNENTKIFFEPEMYRFYDNQIPLILSALYDIKETNGRIFLLKKKKEKTSDNFIFEKDKNDIIHELLENNFANRLFYSKGEKGKIKLGKQFSLEVIFKPYNTPKSIFTKWATIIGNSENNKGVILQQVDTNKTQYVFAISKQGLICPVVLDKWNYFSLELNNNVMRAYVNGELTGVHQIQTPFENTDESLFIGNFMGYSGFYFG